MKKLAGIVALGLFSLLVFECSNAVASENKEGPEVQIQGKYPQEYFNQFIYRAECDCSKPDDLRFTYLRSETVVIGMLPNGSPVLASISIYLNADHSFSADYDEIEFLERISGGYSGRMLLQKHLTGTWKITGDQIVLSNLGRGSGINREGQDAVHFNFDHEIATEGLKGQSALLSFAQMSHDDDLL